GGGWGMGDWDSAAPWPRGGARAPGRLLRLLVEELEVVVGAEVVDEVDGVGAGLDGQAEQVASAAGVVIDGLDGGLPAERGGFHDVPVAAVDGQDVASHGPSMPWPVIVSRTTPWLSSTI